MARKQRKELTTRVDALLQDIEDNAAWVAAVWSAAQASAVAALAQQVQLMEGQKPSAAEVAGMSREEKALSALAAGLSLPRARAATDEARLEPPPCISPHLPISPHISLHLPASP